MGKTSWLTGETVADDVDGDGDDDDGDDVDGDADDDNEHGEDQLVDRWSFC